MRKSTTYLFSANWSYCMFNNVVPNILRKLVLLVLQMKFSDRLADHCCPAAIIFQRKAFSVRTLNYPNQLLNYLSSYDCRGESGTLRFPIIYLTSAYQLRIAIIISERKTSKTFLSSIITELLKFPFFLIWMNCFNVTNIVILYYTF